MIRRRQVVYASDPRRLYCTLGRMFLGKPDTLERFSAISAQTGIDAATVSQIITLYHKAIVHALVTYGWSSLGDLGTLVFSIIPSRLNRKSGEWTVPNHQITFSPSKELKAQSRALFDLFMEEPEIAAAVWPGNTTPDTPEVRRTLGAASSTSPNGDIDKPS